MPKISTLQLTDTRIQRTAVRKHPETGLPVMSYLWDSVVRGFGLRITAQGTKTFCFKFVAPDGTPNGKQAWMPLGDYAPPCPPEVENPRKPYKSPLDVAREKARGFRQLVQDDKDPRNEKKLAEEIPTLEKFIVTFLEEQRTRLKSSSYDSVERILDNQVKPVLGKLRVPDVQRFQVEDLYKKIGKGWRPGMAPGEKPEKPTPIAANRMLANLGRLFEVAIDKEIYPGKNPCRLGKKNKNKESKGNTRFLTELELQWLGQVLRDAPHWQDEDLPETFYSKAAKLPVPSAYALGAIRLLLATGARRNEILNLKWSQVDKVRGVIRIEDHKTDGSMGIKELPINSAVAAVLGELEKLPTRGLGNEYVIQGHSLGEHMVCLQYCWGSIRKAACLASNGEVDLGAVRLHDLRHTHASWGVMSGLSLPKVGNLLGHTQPSTTQRYGHFATDPRLEASELISSKINSALGF